MVFFKARLRFPPHLLEIDAGEVADAAVAGAAAPPFARVAVGVVLAEDGDEVAFGDGEVHACALGGGGGGGVVVEGAAEDELAWVEGGGLVWEGVAVWAEDEVGVVLLLMLGVVLGCGCEGADEFGHEVGEADDGGEEEEERFFGGGGLAVGEEGGG